MNHKVCGICGGVRGIGEAPALLAYDNGNWITVLPCKRCGDTLRHVDGRIDLRTARKGMTHGQS